MGAAIEPKATALCRTYQSWVTVGVGVWIKQENRAVVGVWTS